MRNALICAVGLGGITSLLLEPVSMGVAHQPVMLIVFPSFLAVIWEWPGHGSLTGLYVYQFLYYVILAVIISAAIGMYRGREKRLRSERERANAS